MTRATIKTTAALLIAACLAAATLVLAWTPQAYADDVTVTVKGSNPDGTVDVAEGVSGADAGGASAKYQKTITLSGVTQDKPGTISFDTEATSIYGYIDRISVSYEGQTRTVASCKSSDLADGFYNVGNGVLFSGRSLSIQGAESEFDPRYAPGESYKHGASFVLTGIASNVVIEVEYDWTDQQTLRFYRNYDASDTAIVGDIQWRHYGEEFGKAPTAPVREGYTFFGWATSRDGQPVEWNATELMGLKNLSFYAIWQKSSEPTPPEDEEEVVPPSDDQGDGNDPGENDSNKDGTDEQGSPSGKGSAPALAATGDGMIPIATVAGIGALASALAAGAALIRAKSGKPRNSTRPL